MTVQDLNSEWQEVLSEQWNMRRKHLPETVEERVMAWPKVPCGMRSAGHTRGVADKLMRHRLSVPL